MSDVTRDPAITTLGQDGTRFRYYAMHGDDVAPEHVGWVLVVDGKHEMAPQRVSAAEVAGDLESMQVGDDLPWLLEILRSHTSDMLDELIAREQRPGANAALQPHITAMRADLAAIPKLSEEG
jgi:hypothetical protein